jgi:acyl carrier protein
VTPPAHAQEADPPAGTNRRMSWSELAERRVIRIAETPCVAASPTEIANKVKRLVKEHLGVDEAKVVPEASFVDDLGVDSLDTVELIMSFEEAFGMEISEENAFKMTRVKDAIEFIERNRCNQGTRATGQVRPQGDNEFAELDQRPTPTAEARPPPTASRTGGPCGSLSGVVKWYNSTKGYGFIQPDEPGKDAFVHVAELQRSGLGKLSEKQVVRFNVATVRGLPAASDICVVQ